MKEHRPLPDVYSSPDQTVQQAQDSHVPDREHARTKRRRDVASTVGPLTVTRPNDSAWELAQRLVAEQGWGYPDPQPDGSVIIQYENPRKKKRG